MKVLYFTATGNNLYVAKRIGGEYYSIPKLIYDKVFPLIIVNNSMAKTRQIFTLFHELGHLLFETSGIDKLKDDFVNILPEKDRDNVWILRSLWKLKIGDSNIHI